MIRTLVITLTLLLCYLAKGQTADPLIYTVGKVFPKDGNHYAYVLWQPGNPTTTFGKEFAIYRKDGDAGSGNPYVLLGRTKLQTGPAAIHSLLKLGGQFDFNADAVADRINTLYAESTAQPGTQPAPSLEPGLDEAEKLAYLLNIAADDEKILERVFFLGRAHPGVYMSLGHGFSIKVNPTAVQTYEVREINSLGNDIRVVGRVTLDSANPTELTRTSRPFQIFHESSPEQQEVASGKDHLVARMRWGIPDPLRRLFPHSFGFNVYRVKESVAQSMGWNVSGTFPDANVLESMVKSSLNDQDPDAKRINTLPVIATALMTEAEAQDIVTDSETFFMHDDNEPPTNPFDDGETFYYFIAARDIAGHPGPISAGTRIVICDRLPPTAPVIESIRNIFETDTVANLYELKGNQHFSIRIRQTPDTPAEDKAKMYHIYRWENNTQHISDGGNPLTNLVASIPHVDGQKYIDWEDTGAGAPRITPSDTSQFGISWWYTVRSEDDTACTPKNLSGHSPPAFGVLRDRVGPGKPTGEVVRCRYFPRAFCEDRAFLVSKASLGLPIDYEGFVVRLRRNDQLVASADLQFINLDPEPNELLFQTSKAFGQDTIKDVFIPINIDTIDQKNIRVRGRSKSGVVSTWAVCPVDNLQSSAETVMVMPVDLDVLERCNPVDGTPGSTPPPHDVDGPNGTINGPSITVTLPPTTHEYRIYRRVGNNGTFELIERGSGNKIPTTLPGDISHDDIAPPTANDTEVCYFAQVFDENGNSGPRTKIGCVTIKSGDLGTPMLADPVYQAVNGVGQAQLQLNWFCDPVGVERFEIWAASNSAADPEIIANVIGPKLGNLNGGNVNEDAVDLIFSGYQTKTIASEQIGSGAEFSVLLTVPASQTLSFAVRAVGKGTYQNPPIDDEARPQGPFSNMVTATWKPPAPSNQPVIPWPALAVPDVSKVDLGVDKYKKGEGPFYAAPLPSGDNASASILMGVFNQLTIGDLPGQAFIETGKNPLDLFFNFRKQNIDPVPENKKESVIPFVIYRHQLPNSNFPNAVPNLVQVSPLIDRISYKDNPGVRELRDPFFRFIHRSQIEASGRYTIPISGVFTRDLQGTNIGPPSQSDIPYYKNCDTFLFWVDPMPVVKGARYQYLIVHFTDRGEVDRVIPTNYVDQP